MPPYILIVAADAKARSALAVLLQSAGYDTSEVGDAREALAYLRTHHAPRLVLFDMIMPVLDVQDILAWRQKVPDLAAIPVVSLTAAGAVDADSACGQRTEGALHRPADPEVLLAVVKRYC